MTQEQEKQIAALVKLGETRESAIQILKDDDEGFETEEMKEMEQKAKRINKNAKSVDAYGRKRNIVKKVDKDKSDIIQALGETLTDIADNVVVVNPEQKIDLWLNGSYYTVMLTKHRKAE